MTLIAGAAQSGAVFDVCDDSRNAVSSIIRVPVGMWCVSLTSLILFDVRKRSLLEITRDKLCLARSLCAALCTLKEVNCEAGYCIKTGVK